MHGATDPGFKPQFFGGRGLGCCLIGTEFQSEVLKNWRWVVVMVIQQ